MAPKELKEQYFNSLTMQVGLRYFGGKAMIGKFLINRIFEMQAYRYKKGNPAKVFVDCFTGGGKMALTIPTGWFDKIVMNDLNYGVYSYYVCCQQRPLALINMIEVLGSIMCYDTFKICAKERSTRGKHLPEDILQKLGISDSVDEKGEIRGDADMLLSAAMTYWVTQGSWLGETDPERITYALITSGKNENEEIRKRIRTARKRIMQINQKMTRQTYIIENLDYVNLIEKYRKDYGEDVIWYLDPPYHAATLNKSNGVEVEYSKIIDDSEKSKEEKPAPYEDSFHYEQTMAMTYLLATMKWFIKSDYDPYYFFRDPYEELEKENSRYKLKKADYFHDFDLIENIEEGFLREYLGSFHKGTNTGHDEGMEVIWSRYDGSKESLEYMGVTHEDIEFWEHKKATRRKWLYLNDKIEYLFEPTCVMSNIDDEQKKIEKAEFINKWAEEYEKILKEERPN